MIKSLIISLILTLLIENALAAIIGVRESKDFALISLANVVTNPILVHTLNVIHFIFKRTIRWHLILPLETVMVVAEALFYKNRLTYKKINPFLFSIILNTVSYFGGRVIYEIATKLF